MTDNKKKTHLIVTGRGGGGSSEQVQADWNQTDSEQPDYIKNKPEFATVATSGDYDDLTNKPTIPAAPVQSDWNEADSSSLAYINNKPTIPPQQWFGTQAEYDAIAVKDPNTIYNIEGGGQVQANWTENNSSDPSYIQNKPTLATVATSGSYSDLSNTPSLATVATSGDYDDLSNKPTIPAVPAMAIETLTFTIQGGTTKTIDFYTVPDYFYVEDVSGSNNALRIKKNNANAPDVEVFYSTDKINWDSMGTTSTTNITATIPANGKLYLKANANNWGTTSYYNNINCYNKFNVGGNIMSLIYSDNFFGKTVFPTGASNIFYNLFTQSLIVSAGNLLLPATNVPNDGYSSMFRDCTSLTTAPVVLPATSIASNGYSNMFYGCTSLTTAPEIYGKTLGITACRSMFANCTNLIKIVTYNTKLGIQAHQDWLYNVSATGDFYNLGSAAYPSGKSGIPEGWTVHTSL